MGQELSEPTLWNDDQGKIVGAWPSNFATFATAAERDRFGIELGDPSRLAEPHRAMAKAKKEGRSPAGKA